MSKRKYVLAGSLGVIGALLVSGTASAAVTGFTYSDTISPQKQSAKTFGPAAIHNSLDTSYTGGFAPTPTTTVVQFSKDIKFTAGTLPQCNLNSISTVPDTTAMSLCGASKLGTGSVLVNGGVLTGKVTAYNGVPSGGGEPPIGFHTDLFLAQRQLFVQHDRDRHPGHQDQHPDHPDSAHRDLAHAFRGLDRQGQVGQEEGQADLLRDGPVQEEEVDRHGDGELLRRLEQKRDIGPEVQGEEEVGDSLS